MDTQKRLVALIAGTLVTALILWACASVVWIRGVDRLGAESGEQLDRFVSHLDSQLGRYHFLPKLLTTNDELAKAILDSGNSARLDVINRYLEEVNTITGAADTYLMNADGLTIAASNWAGETPFVGRNFSFRPYFQQAMQGKLGRYYALGTTSGKRGYYFAYPIDHAAAIVGALVLKMDLTGIEERWRGRDTQFLVLDPNGVVFISSEPYWRFKAVNPLSNEARSALILSRRYPDVPLDLLPQSERTGGSDGHTIRQVAIDEQGRSREYLSLDRAMPEAGWTVRVLTPTREITRDVIFTLSVVFLIILLAVAFTLLALQRRKRRLERERITARLNRELELRVAERTVDLTHEIDERRRTEQMLRETQDELIQAAKLAVLGQLSASISHELNNPLAAIRGYADNARQFLRRDRADEADSNLARITELTDRMAKISSQLKAFARKSSGQSESVAVASLIASAVDIVRPQARRQGINIQVGDTADDEIRGNLVQLEQVLINLLSNALHAAEARDEPEVTIHTERRGDQQLAIHVSDNGDGIAEENLSAIFDPFFTTRQSGLGLGLSISQRIIEDMKGELSAANRPGGGARFSVTLPLSESSSTPQLSEAGHA